MTGILAPKSFIFVFFVCWGSALFAFNQAPAYFDAAFLERELGLSSDQKGLIVNIFEMVSHQCTTDRELYTENPDGLYRAACLRREMSDREIKKVLNGDQSKTYDHLVWQRSLRWEFFIINETLLPDGIQRLRIKGVLDEYKKKQLALMAVRRGNRSGGSGFSGRMNGARGMSGGGKRGGGSMRSRGSAKSGDRSSPLKTLNREKYHRIETLLDSRQKALFKSVLQILESEFDRQKQLRIKKRDPKRST